MSRPRKIERTSDGFFISICPKCGKIRNRRSYPPKKPLDCISCKMKGKPHFDAIVLSQEDILCYKNGEPAFSIAKRLHITANTVLASLRRQKIKTRTMSEAGKLFPHIKQLQQKAEELRLSGEMPILMSAGLQKIPIHEWDGFQKNKWDRERSTLQWKLWRKQVFQRDRFMCCECGNTHHLSPHHIKMKSFFPSLIYDVSNGITLCNKCHKNTFGKENKFIKHFEMLLKVALWIDNGTQPTEY